MTVQFEKYESSLATRVTRFIESEGYKWCSGLGSTHRVAKIMYYKRPDNRYVDHVGIMIPRSIRLRGLLSFNKHVERGFHTGTIWFKNDHWRFDMFGIECADQMQELAEKLADKFDVDIKAKVKKKYPNREQSELLEI